MVSLAPVTSRPFPRGCRLPVPKLRSYRRTGCEQPARLSPILRCDPRLRERRARSNGDGPFEYVPHWFNTCRFSAGDPPLAVLARLLARVSRRDFPVAFLDDRLLAPLSRFDYRAPTPLPTHDLVRALTSNDTSRTSSSRLKPRPPRSLAPGLPEALLPRRQTTSVSSLGSTPRCAAVGTCRPLPLLFVP